mgnify:CR=1 FL=1
MAAGEQPWARVRDPALIPDPVTVTGLLSMGDEAFGELIRSHLTPREDQPGGRTRWTVLWAVLGRDDELADRAFDVLEEFIDRTQAAVRAGDLTDAENRRARMFVSRCQDAWSRLEGADSDEPLAWAGKAAAGFNPPGRKVIARLVSAIASHRAAVRRAGGPVSPADERLWHALRAVNLDPEQYDSR